MVSNIPNPSNPTPRIPMMLMPAPDMKAPTIPMLPAVANLLDQVSVALASQSVAQKHGGDCTCLPCTLGRSCAQLADFMKREVLPVDFDQNFADTNGKCPTLAQLADLGLGKDMNDLLREIMGDDDQPNDDTPNPEEN